MGATRDKQSRYLLVFQLVLTLISYNVRLKRHVLSDEMTCSVASVVRDYSVWFKRKDGGMFCAKCGVQLRDGAMFCPSCGSPVVARVVGAATSPDRQRPAESPTNTIVAARPSQAAVNEWRPSTTPELGGSARRIATNRGLLKYILFSILTLGIYGFFFVYAMAQDMNTMCEDDDQKTGGLIAFVLLNIITLGIYGIYWWYRIANRVCMNAPRYGITVAENGTSFLLWYLLGFLTLGIASLVGYHAVIKNVNSLAAAYNRAHGFA